MRKIYTLFLFLTCSLLGNAAVKLPKIFSNHMVLQQEKPINIWGWANPGEKVSVVFNNTKKSILADKSGNWFLTMEPMKAGGPYDISVKGTNGILLTDVMVGEVWLCSGQSNMQFDLKSNIDAENEITASANNLIRHFTVPCRYSAIPTNDFEGGSWDIASPATSGSFSAVAYFYAKKLQAELGVAVGVINASWGGTFIECWLSYDALHALPDYSTYHNITSNELESWYSKTEKFYDNLFSTIGVTDRKNIVEDSSNWVKPGFDDSKWLHTNLPSTFDPDFLPRFDGVVWFRRTIELPQEVAKAGIQLKLGSIDDCDLVFVNGVEVGNTCGSIPMRSYTVKPGLLKPGENTIAIRVLDYWEIGGFRSPVSDFKIIAPNFEQTLAGDWKYTIGKCNDIWIRTPNVHPNLLYNGMLSPILKFPFRGAIWYQGENNCLFSYQYRQVIKALVGDWRMNFSSGSFPFYLVQLPNMNSINSNSQSGGSDWAEMRESQAAVLELPNTGMAVTVDLGDSTNVHPKQKKEVANRLALLALKNTYNKWSREVNSPVFSIVRFAPGKAFIGFKNIGTGLVVNNKYGYAGGFEVAGKDQKFYWAKTYLINNEVVASCSQVPEPVVVRYGWANNPSDNNMFNSEGLPLAPFRTDNWEVSTQIIKYQKWLK